jgi:hypothetical protein
MGIRIDKYNSKLAVAVDLTAYLGCIDEERNITSIG